MRDKVQSCEFLEYANRNRGAENGDRARKTYVFRARCGRTQNHGRGGIQEFGPVVFADAKNIETHLVGELNLFQQILHPLDRAEGETRWRVGDDRSEAVDADLHPCDSAYG
jgi:hypothetical protein